MFTWRWGTLDRWGWPLRWGKKITLLYMRSAIPEYTLQDYWMVAKHLNKKNADKPSFWWLMLFYTLTCCSCCNLQCCGFLLLPLIMMQSYGQSEFCANSVSRIRHRLGGLPHRETFTWRQNLNLAERVARYGRPGYPPWRVTPLSDKCFCWFLAAMRVPVHPDGHRRGVFIQSSLVFG